VAAELDKLEKIKNGERKKIQKQRSVSDLELEKVMNNKSIEYEMRNTIFG